VPPGSLNHRRPHWPIRTNRTKPHRMRKLSAEQTNSAEPSNRRRALLPSLSSKASNGLGSSRAANSKVSRTHSSEAYSKGKRLPVSATRRKSRWLANARSR
jgi:hypothetical protein